MEYALIGLLALFLVFLFIEMKRKSERIKIAVADEKRKIADDSGMTASLGVFTPDTQTTVIIGSSEELGIFLLQNDAAGQGYYQEPHQYGQPGAHRVAD